MPTNKATTPEGEQETKQVNVQMPTVSINCPYCEKEDDHSSSIWSNSEGYALATGETYCDHCDKWFEVNLML